MTYTVYWRAGTDNVANDFASIGFADEATAYEFVEELKKEIAETPHDTGIRDIAVCEEPDDPLDPMWWPKSA